MIVMIIHNDTHFDKNWNNEWTADLLLLLLLLSRTYICVVVIGAVFIQDASPATVTDTTFENNFAGGDGGAVFSNGPVTTDGSNVFNGNTPNDVVDS